MRTLRAIRATSFAIVALGIAMAKAQVPALPKLDESEVALLQPMLGRVALADTITAFAIPDGALLPLGELSRLLAFGIRVDAGKGRAEGFFISEKRRFMLDLVTGTAESDGKKTSIAPRVAVRLNSEVFVDTRLLEAWFPVEIKVDLKAAAVYIKAKEKLPIQDEWEREGKYAGGSLGPASQSQDDNPIGEYLPTPYRFFDVPFVDLTTFWNKGQHTPSRPPAGSLALGGDLFWMSSSIFVSRDSDGKIRNPSYTLSREDPHKELLGFMHATRVELGNLLHGPSQDLVGALPAGRGVLVDNFPIAYRSKFATRSFQGLLREGWSVELYQNKSLVGHQKSGVDGRYVFLDLPLRFGLNQFKLVFHGPFGQTREENYRIDIASDQPPPGAFYYRLVGLRPLSIDSFSDVNMNPSGQVASDTTRKGTDALVEMEYGLSSSLALNTSVSKIAFPDGHTHTYDVAGFRSMFSYLALQGSIAQDNVPDRAPGVAAEGILRTGYEYSTFSLQRSEYRRGFQTMASYGARTLGGNLRSETLAQLDGSLPIQSFPVGLSFLRHEKRYVDGGWSVTNTARSTFSFASLMVSPCLSKITGSGQSGPSPLTGGVLLTSSLGGHSLQGEVNFERAAGKTKLTSWGFLGDWSQPSGLIYRVGLRGPDGQLKNTVLLASLSKLTGSLGFGLDTQYSKTAGYNIGLRAQISFGRDPRTGSWVHQARPMAGLGAVSLAAFSDANGNKILDTGEQILDGTRFKVGNSSIENEGKHSKFTFQTNLARSQEVVIQMDEASLEDPSLQSTVKAYRIVPRPGKVARVDFPIASFGEINGTTRLRRNGSSAEFGGLELELLKGTGERFRCIRSAYDGFFELRDLPLGDYLLRVTPEEVRRLKLKASPVRKFHIDSVKNLFDGQDMVVEPLQGPLQPANPSSLPTPKAEGAPLPSSAAGAHLESPQSLPGAKSVPKDQPLGDADIAKAHHALPDWAGEIPVEAFLGREGRNSVRRVSFERFHSMERPHQALTVFPSPFFLENTCLQAMRFEAPSSLGRLS